MEIAYLKELGFRIEENIDELKISKGKVELEKDGETSKIIEPDLRYYWDGERFGLHVSDYYKLDFNEIIASLIIYEDQRLLNCLYLLYICRTNIKSFIPSLKNSKLTFFNLSSNKDLEFVNLSELVNLQDLGISFCPNLAKIEFNNSYPLLEKLDISNCNLTELDVSNLKSLQYLNVSKNRIEELDIPKSSSLKYFFGKGNPKLNISKWPLELNVISIFETDRNLALGDDLLDILKLNDENLQVRLNAYLKQIQKGKESGIGCKLIFIGNSTVGKSTLRRILMSDEGKEEEEAKKGGDSTHGVEVFEPILKLGKIPLSVQGFDFGGQDYFHSTQVPFISHNSLNILVYGEVRDENDTEILNAYQFGTKRVGEREEVIYPINYWIGSLKKNNVLQLESEEEVGKFLEHRKHENITYSLDGLKVSLGKEEKQIYLGESDLALIQNLRSNGISQEINNLNIKSQEYVSVLDFTSFNLHNRAKEVKEWLVRVIEKHAAGRPLIYLKTDHELINWFKEQDKVVYQIKELFNEKFIEEQYIIESDLTEALKRIHSHNFGYYFEINGSDPVYINKISEFSKWIHDDILTKEFVKENNGYFKLEDLNLTNGAKEHQTELIAFLEKHNIIFEIKNASNKWVAPAYLPKVQSQSEKLLLQSFGKPDCIFEFEGFFHSNIILMLIDKFEEQLVLDPIRKEYLLWKNKVIFYQKSQNEKAYLFIELKYPGDDGFEGYFPQLCIARNASGFIMDGKFKDIFDYVRKEVINFEPKISIKTRYEDYIPFECLNQRNHFEGKNRSNLIFHNQTIYSAYDFRHLLDNQLHNPVKVFLGYSQLDISYLNELLVHLKPYEKQGEIVVYYDKDLKMGEIWDEELKHQLSTCDVLLCLVTANMLATDYVVDMEIPLAVHHKLKIVPILLSECNWNYSKINNGENLISPNQIYDKAKPLPATSYERQKIWSEIVMNLVNIKSNGTNPPNGSASPDEHLSGTDKTDVGE